MSKFLTVLALLSPALLLPAAAPSAAQAAGTAGVQRAGLFGGRGIGFSRRPSYGSRYRYGYRTRSPYAYRRPFHVWGSPFGGFLKVLGVAYLFHALFGWGPGGGSPIGLFLLIAFVAWLVTRSRRRPLPY